MLGAALVHISLLEQQLVAGKYPQSDVAVKLALNRPTSKVSEAVRAKEALEANNAAVFVDDLRAVYTRVANRFLPLDSGKLVKHDLSVLCQSLFWTEIDVEVV